MRDRDAETMLREITALCTTGTEVLPEIRSRVRGWRADGFPPGRGTDGAGGSNGESHNDPVLSAIVALEIRAPGRNGKRLGWRDDKAAEHILAELDRRLLRLRDTATEFGRALEALTNAPNNASEDGCALCNAARLPMKKTANDERPDHDCNAECRARDHRHESSHQSVYNRQPPKPAVDDDPVEPLARCRFHWEFAARLGVDANPTITIWHLDHPGVHIPTSMLRDHHARAYRRVNDQRRQGASA